MIASKQNSKIHKSKWRNIIVQDDDNEPIIFELTDEGRLKSRFPKQKPRKLKDEITRFSNSPCIPPNGPAQSSSPVFCQNSPGNTLSAGNSSPVQTSEPSSPSFAPTSDEIDQLYLFDDFEPDLNAQENYLDMNFDFNLEGETSIFDFSL